MNHPRPHPDDRPARALTCAHGHKRPDELSSGTPRRALRLLTRAAVLSLGLVAGWNVVTTTMAPTPALAYEWPGRLAQASADLKHPDPAKRVAALKGLVYFPLEDVAPLLINALEDRSPSVQIAAIEALVELRAYDTAPRLEPFLNDYNPLLRIGAIQALGELGSRQDLDNLVRALGDGDAKVRAATITALSRLGLPETQAPIATMLADRDPAVVVIAIDALARLGDRTAAFPLLEKIKDPSLRIQISAVQALGRLGDPRAAMPLLGLLEDPAPEVQLAVIDSLGRLGDPRATRPLIKLMWRHHRNARGLRIIYALGDIGDPRCADALLQVMRYSESAQAAADALKKLGSSAIPKTLEALRQSQNTRFQRLCLGVVQHALSDNTIDDALRRQTLDVLLPAVELKRYPELETLDALILSRHPDALPPLMARLSALTQGAPDQTPDASRLRLHILRGLADFEDARITEPLSQIFMDRLHQFPEEEQRLIATAMGNTRSEAAIPFLIKALAQADLELQLATIRALGKIDHPQAGRQLLERMRNDQSHLLPELGLSLANHTSPEITDALLEIVNTGRGEVRLTALQALSDHVRRSDDDSLPIAILNMAQESAQERFTARAIDAIGPRPVSGGTGRLQTLYSRAGLLLKIKILQVLGDWADPDARGLLLEALQESNAHLRAEAAWALGQIGDQRDADALVELLADTRWPVSLNAAAALQMVAAPATQGALEARLINADDYTQANILMALIALDATPTLKTLRRISHQGTAPQLVEAVGRALARLNTDESRRALRDLSARTTHTGARQTLRRLLGEDAAEQDKGQGWVRYIFSDEGRRMVGQRVIITLPVGVLLGRASDAAGEVRVEKLGQGKARITFLDDTFSPL